MQSQMIAILLCVFASTAGAHSLVTEAAPTSVQRANIVTPPSPSSSPSVRADRVPARPLAASNARPGIITAAGAATPDGRVQVRDQASIARATMGASAEAQPSEGRGSVAMVLAALALMSGIALRRFGSTGR